MFSANADTSGIDAYVGAMSGILDAISSEKYQGNFIDSTMDAIERSFLVDSIANKHNIAHVFEWPSSADDEPSNEPLFRLTRSGRGGHQNMSYEFLPSKRLVPLPSSRFGIDPGVLGKLKRHRFPMKAWVMEYKASVTIAPKNSERLFIPTARSHRGYIMTKQATEINPGGPQATGAFARWYNGWFATRGQEIVNERSELEEVWIASQARIAIREISGKRFAQGTKTTINYSALARQKAETRILRESERRADDDV